MDYNEYNFATSVLFDGAENKINEITTDTRDEIFNWILEEFKDKPLRVYQVGAIETFRFGWRVGSGWSDMIFGPHIRDNGGKLTVVDVSVDNLAKTLLAAKSIGYDVQMICGDALDFMDYDTEPYDVYYLDGSNDPRETLKQFNKIKDNKCIVIVDDFSIKGTLLQDYNFVVKNVANKVGILDMRDKNE